MPGIIKVVNKHNEIIRNNGRPVVLKYDTYDLAKKCRIQMRDSYSAQRARNPKLQLLFFVAEKTPSEV